MAEPDSFYRVYGGFDDPAVAEIRRETYGTDVGQFSWTTADELRHFAAQLELNAASKLLDLACGSGGPALFIAETTGASVTGIDVNATGIAAAQSTADARGLAQQARFQCADASSRLPLEDSSFDAIISIDAMNHFVRRMELLHECRRVLRHGGHLLFTDATIVTGTLSRDEIMARSSAMGMFLFTPAGEHESLLSAAGFVDVRVEDMTAGIAAVAGRWFEARARRRNDLLKTESAAEFETMQNMLAAAHTLAEARRLSRFAYFARKPA